MLALPSITRRELFLPKGEGAVLMPVFFFCPACEACAHPVDLDRVCRQPDKNIVNETGGGGRGQAVRKMEDGCDCCVDAAVRGDLSLSPPLSACWVSVRCLVGGGGLDSAMMLVFVFRLHSWV